MSGLIERKRWFAVRQSLWCFRRLIGVIGSVRRNRTIIRVISLFFRSLPANSHTFGRTDNGHSCREMNIIPNSSCGGVFSALVPVDFLAARLFPAPKARLISRNTTLLGHNVHFHTQIPVSNKTRDNGHPGTLW